MSFACIFVPDFPVEAILRAEPELRPQAVAVLEGKPPLEKVFAVNEKARRAGIDPGMTKIQVEAYTDLVLRARSLRQETTAHAALLDCAQSFSPVVEETGGDIILFDLTGLESLFGPPQKMARAVARRASDLGLEVNVAVASNPDAAMISARGFAGVTVLEPGKEAERLGTLAIEVLFGGLSRIDQEKESEQLLETLERWGVRNLRTLAALPEIALAERLGQKGVHLQKLARGGVSRTLVPITPPLVFEETVELEFPLVLLEPLALLLQRMLDQICARLASRALATQEIRLQMELDSGFLADEATEYSTKSFEENRGSERDLPQTDTETGIPPALCRDRHLAPVDVGTGVPARPGRAQAQRQETGLRTKAASLFTRTLHFPVPMLDAKIFLKLLQLDLKAHPPGAPILKVHLKAEPSPPRSAQNGLFQPVTPEPEKLELTLARISGIVGEGKAGSLELLDTHRPEAFRMQHFAPEPQTLKRTSKNIFSAGLKSLCANSSEKQHEDAPLTALRMFRPPLRATVTMRDGKPKQVDCNRCQEVRGEIVWLAGPWRSSGDWWQQDGWAREEWDIAVQAETSFALYRLVHDLLSGRWFVEGTYD
jgi:nucleotidyltransferase/DNA polymerase involved in DNA repair